LDNARQLFDAGADILVVSSAIFDSEDIGATIAQFNKINLN
jgi:pentose-5-phosphate-3-epimerase